MVNKLELYEMVIISRPVIREFIFRYPLSAGSLNDWYEKTKRSDWSKFADIRKSWNSCDFIGNDRYVFDIGGNNYRLIAMIHFKNRTLYIRKILTHSEYTQCSKKGTLNTQ
jgi:mRNA interferase HigB